jgi:hypothetical protein
MSNPFALLKRLSEPPLSETYTASCGPINQSIVVNIGDDVVYNMYSNPNANEERITWEESAQLAEKVKSALLTCDLASYNAILIVTSCTMKSTNCYIHTVSVTLYRLL